MPKTRNIANDVNATAKRYCRLWYRVPAVSLFPTFVFCINSTFDLKEMLFCTFVIKNARMQKKSCPIWTAFVVFGE